MGWLLVLAFLVVPVVEIYVIVQVGQEIGALPTVALLLFESALGAWIVRREGSRAWAALRGAVSAGQLPSRELADAALVLVGGTLLLTPGFVTDVFGFFFVLPFTRPLARRLLAGFLARRATVTVGRFGPAGGRPAAGPASDHPRGTGGWCPDRWCGTTRRRPTPTSPGHPRTTKVRAASPGGSDTTRTSVRRSRLVLRRSCAGSGHSWSSSGYLHAAAPAAPRAGPRAP